MFVIISGRFVILLPSGERRTNETLVQAYLVYYKLTSLASDVELDKRNITSRLFGKWQRTRTCFANLMAFVVDLIACHAWNAIWGRSLTYGRLVVITRRVYRLSLDMTGLLQFGSFVEVNLMADTFSGTFFVTLKLDCYSSVKTHVPNCSTC